MATPINDLSSGIERHAQAITSLSGALGRYREGITGQTNEDEAEQELLLAAQQLDAAGATYERTSLALAGIIIDDLIDTQRSDDDRVWLTSNAVTRLAAMIAIDAKVAEQAALLADIREPQATGREYLTRRLTRAESDDLGQELASAAEPMFAELRQGNDAGTPAAARSGPAAQAVDRCVSNVLDRAADDIVGTIGAAIGWAHRLGTLLADLTSGAVGWSAEALAELTEGLSPLRRLLARAWRQVISKVGILVGQRVRDIATAIVGKLDLLHKTAKAGTGLALRKLLEIDKVASKAKALAETKPHRAKAAIRACDEVDHHHERRRWGVPWLNKALPACGAIHFGGVALEALAAAAVLIYSVWLVHDHLDSPIAASIRLPRNPGLLTNVESAVA